MTSLALALVLLQGIASPPTAVPRVYPFGVGETLSYSAKLGLITLGSGTLQVASIDTIRGSESFRFRFRLTGKNMFYSLDDILESWVATDSFNSLRFVQDFTENDKRRQRRYEIYPDSGFFREHGKDTALAAPANPLDDAAFFYFIRVTPLQLGRSYEYDRYFRKDKNPVRITVVKRETMELPGGRKAACLVLRPVIDTKGMFSKRSETQIWLTEDARRLPVQIRTRFPFGTVTLRLTDVRLAAGR